MSYPPPQPPTGQTQPPTAAYPYGAYHPSPYGHPQTPGAYTYSPGAYQTGVTSYGWPYSYGYLPQHPQPTPGPTAPQIPRPTPTAASVATHTPLPTSLPQRSATFSAYTPSYNRESVPSVPHTAPRGSRRQSNLKGLFTKELRSLMYGFGDDRNPANDTVNVMEEILIEYITDICQTASGPSKKSRLSIDDLRRALSRPADAKKLARMEELLFMQEDIKRARAQFEESDIQHPKGM